MLRHFDAAAVRAALPFATLVPALHRAFVTGAVVPLRHTHAIDGPQGEAGRVLLMPAWRVAAGTPLDVACVDGQAEPPGPGSAARSGGRFGVKAVTIFPRNGDLGLPAVHAVYLMFDAATGVPLASFDGSELTARRTAAASALAASFLARGDARRLVLVGAGRVAALLPEAMRTVRPGLRSVAVWNRTAAGAQRLAQALADAGFPGAGAVPEGGLAAAVAGADIVSCATLSNEALVRGAWLQPGTHLDLIGGFTPAMREADGACFERAAVYVDTDEALMKSGDILQAMAEGCFEAARLRGTLATLCGQASSPGRARAGGDATAITLFKSVGTALEDLAAAEAVFDAADNRGPPTS